MFYIKRKHYSNCSVIQLRSQDVQHEILLIVNYPLTQHSKLWVCRLFYKYYKPETLQYISTINNGKFTTFINIESHYLENVQHTNLSIAY